MGVSTNAPLVSVARMVREDEPFTSAGKTVTSSPLEALIETDVNSDGLELAVTVYVSALVASVVSANAANKFTFQKDVSSFTVTLERPIVVGAWLKPYRWK